MTNKFPIFLDWGVKGLLTLIVILAIFGSIYFLTETIQIKETSILTVDGIDYSCMFYHNGDMLCKGVNDVNVGAGRISP